LSSLGPLPWPALPGRKELAESKRRLREAVEAADTTLTDIYGVGPVVAGLLIGYTGDISRFPTKHHYATYNGTAPIDASSGSRKRHRLNPRGNRMLNHALHLIAITQLRYPDTQGRVFYERKLAEGKTSKEAIRYCRPAPIPVIDGGASESAH